MGFSLVLASDDRFRGLSTSEKRPVGTATISYDDAGGFYVGGSVTGGKLPDESFRLLRSNQYAGYTRRLGSDLNIDVGVIHRIYSHRIDLEYAWRFTEFYAGLAGRRGAARIFFAPGYGRYGGGSAVYGELQPSIYSDDRWALTGHVGVLVPPNERRLASHALEVDTRLSLVRRFGRATLSAGLIGKGPDQEAGHWRAAPVVAFSRAF